MTIQKNFDVFCSLFLHEIQSSGQSLQDAVNNYWKEHKKNVAVVDQKITQLRNCKYKGQPSIISAFCRIPTAIQQVIQPNPVPEINEEDVQHDGNWLE